VLSLPTRLPGAYNGLNVAAALAAADALGLDLQRSAEAIAAMPGVPGRFEPVRCGQPFDVVVDFAHTPDGIAQALQAARDILRRRGAGRLHVVLGALSVLGPAQREQMGRAAGGEADRLTLTTDRRAAGQPSDVPRDLIRGAEGAGAHPVVIPDRRLALESALAEAAPGDLVGILGRGSVDGPLFDPDGNSRPFDDREVTGELLRELAGQPA
jgi:UDP-N-acetylmuramoyl-L-alanyl-D-glutamate--2,6-diaminopimelate ligase